MQQCKECRIQLHGREANTVHESSTSFADHRTRLHKHNMIPTWKQHLPSCAVESTRTMVLRCKDCPEMFNTFKEKYEHQVDRECPCGIYFRCRSQFSRHVTLRKCKPPLLIRRLLPFIKCNCCSQSFINPSELLAHQRECGRDVNRQNEEPANIHCTIKRTKRGKQRECTRCGKKSPCDCISERIEEGCEKDESVQQEPSTSIRGATEKTLHQSGKCTCC
jgi:hypothetical protein